MTPDPGPVPATDADIRIKLHESRWSSDGWAREYNVDVTALLAERDALRNGQVPGAAVAAWESLLNDAEQQRDALLAELARVQAKYRRRLKRVGPATRAFVAEEIAADIEAYEPGHPWEPSPAYLSGQADAARIAREHAAPPAAAWRPAKTGDTPGQLAPGEGDAPEPLVLGPIGTVMLAAADDKAGFYEPDEPVADVVAALQAGVQHLTGPPTLDGPSTRALGHFYLSTGCYHRLCDDPRPDGTAACRVTCKWCPAKCECSCHVAAETD